MARKEIEVHIWSWLVSYSPDVMFRVNYDYPGSKGRLAADVPRILQGDDESEHEFMFRIWRVASDAIIAGVIQNEKLLKGKTDSLRMLPLMRQFRGQRIDIGIEE